MSNRVFKKLYGEKDLASALGVDGMSESDDGGASQVRGAREKTLNNRFELLNSVEHSLSDTEAKEDDDREIEVPQDGQERNKLEKQDSTHSTDSLKRKKKKKKKKLKSQKSTEENLKNTEDEIEASVREVNKLFGEPEPSTSTFVDEPVHTEKHVREKSILSIDPKHLNPDNEMKRRFGSKVVQSEQVKRRGRGKIHGKSTILVSPKNWPHLGKPGLSMSLLESKDDINYFAFEHSKQYQSIQLQFLDAVETFNPDNIVSLLNTYPYHVDALIQFSEICKMGEDTQMAAELIERSIFYMENCLHPLFNICQGNCRLDYRRAENRSFYIAIFKHLMYVGQRGCNRTSLEFCKYLLSLEPENDPLAIILVIDFYALRSQQYSYLIKFYNEWNLSRNLYQLPNFAFSVPLAMFLQEADSDGETNADEADSMLQKALIMFPGFVYRLLEKCDAEPVAGLASHSYFNRKNDPPALVQLYSLYVARTYKMWKAPHVMPWLDKNVRIVMQRHADNDPLFPECEATCKVRYARSSRNVMRHTLLANLRDAAVLIPPEYMQNPILGFDPLPPTDSIVSYKRPTRPPSNNDDRGALSMFFRSLMPNFNVPRDVAAAEAHGEDGALAVDRGDTNDLRRSVTSLLDAMRDLISNINLADVPNEGDVDSDEDRDA